MPQTVSNAAPGIPTWGPRKVLFGVLCGALLLTGCPSPEVLITLPDAYPEGAGHSHPGLVGIPNLDDDNENSVTDWDEGELTEPQRPVDRDGEGYEEAEDPNP